MSAQLSSQHHWLLALLVRTSTARIILHLISFPRSVIIWFITSAEREVKGSRRSGMSQSCFFVDKTGHAKSVGFRFSSTIWRNKSRINSRYLEVTKIFNLFEEEKIIILAYPGFELTHVCGPSDQVTLEGLVDCSTATQGSLEFEK